MPLLNYTTGVPADNTINEIHKCLATHGARAILNENCLPMPGTRFSTPWASYRPADELQVVYRLDEFKLLTHSIENKKANGRGQAVREHRWASRLSLERATVLEELALETEPEWRLYEDLRAQEITFHIEPGPVVMVDPGEPAGRAWFVTAAGIRTRYAGAAGFILRLFNGAERYFGRPEDLIKKLLRAPVSTGANRI